MNILDRKRRAAYRAVFCDGTGTPTPNGEIVLADLRKFCRMLKTTSIYSLRSGQIDPVASAHAEGRRETFLRILAYLYLEERVFVQLQDAEVGNG